MRPVDKGELTETLTEYQDAKHELLTRLGGYCSYCERHGDLAVEHKAPKSLYPLTERAWLNLLLACVNCNSIKKDKDTLGASYFFPDTHNTAHLYLYGPGARVRVNTALSDVELIAAAQRTLELVGLERIPVADPKRRDDRWRKRDEAWRTAESSRASLAQCPTEELRETITNLAVATGFFSVWMTVFHEDPEMCQRFIMAFPGTRRSCFDEQGRCIPSISV